MQPASSHEQIRDGDEERGQKLDIDGPDFDSSSQILESKADLENSEASRNRHNQKVAGNWVSEMVDCQTIDSTVYRSNVSPPAGVDQIINHLRSQLNEA